MENLKSLYLKELTIQKLDLPFMPNPDDRWSSFLFSLNDTKDPHLDWLRSDPNSCPPGIDPRTCGVAGARSTTCSQCILISFFYLKLFFRLKRKSTLMRVRCRNIVECRYSYIINHVKHFEKND